ncbi:acyltransferase [Proteus vulgaris]|uniref:acyltransferase n=1 Tax=Proteus vulgaris TaxID=585 RepID=UPI00287445D2|nr:acyltransferase [Proteus vulgaris]MDS0788085.1 acyltransferase [Proteus vulgaris]
MSGKNKFNKYKFIINIFCKLLCILPYKIKIFIYDISMPIPTIFGVGIRYILIKSLCKEVGDNVYIGRYVVIKNFKGITIGKNVSIHEFCYLDGLGCIEIKNDVSIAHNCSIISFEHSYLDNSISIKYNEIIKNNIIINSNVWIGCGCKILSGSHICERAIVGAGSVVKGMLYSNKIYAGVPVRIIKELL